MERYLKPTYFTRNLRYLAMLRTTLAQLGSVLSRSLPRVAAPETFPPLTRLGKPTRRVRFVCMYQNDILEKNIQVPLMGLIYSYAKSVLV